MPPVSSSDVKVSAQEGEGLAGQLLAAADRLVPDASR